MSCWGNVIDDLKTAIAGTTAFVSFIEAWGGTAATAADHVFRHTWPAPLTEEDHYAPEELEARYRAYALLRIVSDNGYSIVKTLATHTAKIHGQIEIELARLVPHTIRHDMEAVLQQAITATEPVIREVMEESNGLWQVVESDGFPWRTLPEHRKTMGDYHGVTYILSWGHPQGLM